MVLILLLVVSTVVLQLDTVNFRLRGSCAIVEHRESLCMIISCYS